MSVPSFATKSIISIGIDMLVPIQRLPRSRQRKDFTKMIEVTLLTKYGKLVIIRTSK